MASVEEADESLVADVGGECSAKYGEVLDVRVQLSPPADDDAGIGADVRVFVRFSKQSSAMRAYLDLEGRYFNERRLVVWFYPEDAFDAGLLDQPLR